MGVHFIRAAATLISLFMSLWLERRALRRLDQRLLDDIGVNLSQAQKEGERPFWDVPSARHPGPEEFASALGNPVDGNKRFQKAAHF